MDGQWQTIPMLSIDVYNSKSHLCIGCDWVEVLARARVWPGECTD